jgi:hypothetical protein
MGAGGVGVVDVEGGGADETMGAGGAALKISTVETTFLSPSL